MPCSRRKARTSPCSTRQGLKARFPWLNVEDIALGAFGVTGEGWFDAHALLAGVRRMAKLQGAHLLTGEVTGIERANNRVSAVTLADGRRLGCGALVNAAGPQAGRVAALAGIPLPVEGRKRCVFVVHCRTPIEGLPLLVDPSGFYIRPEGAYQICGAPPPEELDTNPGEDFEVDWSVFEEIIWPALAHRIPAMEELKPVRAWAGHYEMNLLDHNAVIGPHPRWRTSISSTASPATASSRRRRPAGPSPNGLVHGRSISLDLDVFGYERIAAGRPYRELNII